MNWDPLFDGIKKLGNSAVTLVGAIAGGIGSVLTYMHKYPGTTIFFAVLSIAVIEPYLGKWLASRLVQAFRGFFTVLLDGLEPLLITTLKVVIRAFALFLIVYGVYLLFKKS